MNQALSMIRKLLSGDVTDIMRFSIDLEDTLTFEYETLYAYDPASTKILCKNCRKYARRLNPIRRFNRLSKKYANSMSAQ